VAKDRVYQIGRQTVLGGDGPGFYVRLEVGTADTMEEAKALAEVDNANYGA
jgi:hypothetical protein